MQYPSYQSLLAVALASFGGLAHAQLVHNAIGPAVVADFAPPGNLYDNDVSNITTSLASQNSTGTLTARTADDFVIPSAGCVSNTFNITNVRVQMVQNDAAPQAFGLELYDDNGMGTAPTPAGAITPIAAFTQTTQANLGMFAAGTSLFEASFATTGLQLQGGVVYWLSAFGVDAAANAASFNNFFAASDGAVGTTDNGVVIAPGAGVATWTPVEAVIGAPPLAFSFALDGACVQVVPVLGTPWLLLLGGVLAGLGLAFAAYRRVV